MRPNSDKRMAMPHANPGNVVTVFRSRLNPGMAEEYAVLSAEILELARQMPGFVSLDRYAADDGTRLSVVVFENAETAQAWRAHPRHIAAQTMGRERFFAEYSIAVCECLRSHHSELAR